MKNKANKFEELLKEKDFKSSDDVKGYILTLPKYQQIEMLYDLLKWMRKNNKK